MSRPTCYECNKCGKLRKSDILPAGWRYARDGYGEAAHACSADECQRWLRSFAAKHGLEVYPSSTKE